MLQKLADDAERHCRDMGPHACSVDDVDRASDAGNQDLGFEIVIVKYLNQLPYQFHSRMADIIQSANERTDERRPGLGSYKGLGCGKDKRDVYVDPLTRERFACSDAIGSAGHLDVDMGVHL